MSHTNTLNMLEFSEVNDPQSVEATTDKSTTSDLFFNDEEEGNIITSTIAPVSTNAVHDQPSTMVSGQTAYAAKNYSYEDIEFENNEISFLGIVRWLIWKNFLQQWQRRKFSLLCKLLCPAICVILIGCLRLVIFYDFTQIKNKHCMGYNLHLSAR